MAEQVAKESMEELYQAEIESLGQEISKSVKVLLNLVYLRVYMPNACILVNINKIASFLIYYGEETQSLMDILSFPKAWMKSLNTFHFLTS